MNGVDEGIVGEGLGLDCEMMNRGKGMKGGGGMMRTWLGVGRVDEIRRSREMRNIVGR